MIDLVERLRVLYRLNRYQAGNDFREAADEIERLRGACRSYEQQANRDAMRLAEAERLITLAAGFPMNKTPWQTIAESLNAFLTGEKYA